MKITSIFLVSVVLFAWIAPAPAGEVAAPIAPAMVDSGSLIDPVSGVVSVGYDSHYIFRGNKLGENSLWTQVELGIPVGDDAIISVGAWYQNPVDGVALNPDGEDELDLFVSYGRRFGDYDVWLGYTAYLYPEAGGGNTNEIGLGAGTTVGPIDLGAAAFYDFDLGDGTWYFELTAGHTVALTDEIGLSITAGIGFESVKDSNSDEFTHVDLVASLPITLTDTAVLEPYIAGVWALDGRDDLNDDEVYGGVSLAVSF